MMLILIRCSFFSHPLTYLVHFIKDLCVGLGQDSSNTILQLLLATKGKMERPIDPSEPVVRINARLDWIFFAQ